MKKAGTIIFIIGLLATVFTRFNFATREKVMEVGNIQITQNENHPLVWPPAVGMAMMFVGGVVYAFGFKKRSGPSLLSK